MPKIDLYPGPIGNGYLLDDLTGLFDGLNTCAVKPLSRPRDSPRPARWLNPILSVSGVDHVLVTQYLAALPKTLLTPPVDNLRDNFAVFTAAMEMLIQGL